MAFLPKSEMTNLTKLSTEKGYYIGRWGEETQIINSSSTAILNGVRLLDSDGSNYITLAATDPVSSNYTISFPAAAPSANTFLKYNGSAFVWAAGGGGGGSGDVNNGGNSFGSNMSIGTTDTFSLSFIANNISYATVNTSGAWTFGAGGGSQTHAINGNASISGLTASRALVTDGSKVLTSSAVTSTELGYLSGVTSAIQTQIGTKVTKGGDTDGAALRIGTNDANSLEFETNNTLFGSINSSGLWTLGASAGTQTHAVNGRLTVTSGTSQDAVVVLTPTTNNQGVRQYHKLTSASTTGSTYSEWEVSGGTKWSAGFMASTSTFVISQEDGLGTASKNFFKISTAGLVTIGASSGTQNHVLNGNLRILANGSLRLEDTSGGEYVELKSSGTQNTYTITLPASAPASDSILYYNTSSTFVWSTSIKSSAISGVTDGSDASSGIVGEYVESIVSTATNYTGTTGQYMNLTSVSLTAGDWDISGSTVQFQNGATVSTAAGSDHAIAISVNSGNTTTDHVECVNQVPAIQASSAGTTPRHNVLPNYRLNLTSTTTVYLKMKLTYSAGTPQYKAYLRARRVR